MDVFIQILSKINFTQKSKITQIQLCRFSISVEEFEPQIELQILAVFHFSIFQFFTFYFCSICYGKFNGKFSDFSNMKSQGNTLRLEMVNLSKKSFILCEN